MVRVQNVHVRELIRLKPPRALLAELPLDQAAARTVVAGREAVQRILDRSDSRILLLVGPCSIHDPEAAIDYARRLIALRRELHDTFEIVMRVYFEKPRTTIGWKGLINDPHLDGTYDIETGLRRARSLLLEITRMGLPAGTEFLDPIVPQYIADLISWAAIGARTTESQTHREMASGLSMPVGFKNGTDGSLQVAIDAMQAARHPHAFLGVDEDGITSIVRTTGNPWGHIVLRGGRQRPNYDPESIRQAEQQLAAAGLPQVIMVDCSHANSGKIPARQEDVWRSVIQQRCHGTQSLVGIMLESNLFEGNQPFPRPVHELRYGVSITDPCISWETTERLLRWGAAELARAGLGATRAAPAVSGT
ncbi:MAG: phospho-2-dehydro-3-deoxyheptonate aldolase [Limisphaera sp.]|nr:MAG: phospho-2-dehydro-3-deoxyheptonate aldolase [Limisphaera sp.]